MGRRRRPFPYRRARSQAVEDGCSPWKRRTGRSRGRQRRRVRYPPPGFPGRRGRAVIPKGRSWKWKSMRSPAPVENGSRASHYSLSTFLIVMPQTIRSDHTHVKLCEQIFTISREMLGQVFFCCPMKLVGYRRLINELSGKHNFLICRLMMVHMAK